MEFFTKLVDFWNSNAVVIGAIFAALFAASEALASIPSIQSSSVFQLIKNGLKWIVTNLFKKV